MNVMNQRGFGFEVPHKSQVVELEAREKFMEKKIKELWDIAQHGIKGLTRSNVKLLNCENNWNN
jgi:hypothetical protein